MDAVRVVSVCFTGYMVSYSARRRTAVASQLAAVLLLALGCRLHDLQNHCPLGSSGTGDTWTSVDCRLHAQPSRSTQTLHSGVRGCKEYSVYCSCAHLPYEYFHSIRRPREPAAWEKVVPKPRLLSQNLAWSYGDVKKKR